MLVVLLALKAGDKHDDEEVEEEEDVSEKTLYSYNFVIRCLYIY